MVIRLFATMLAVLAAPVAAQEVGPGETLLQIEAQGEASVRPDAAFVTMGVVSTGTTAREATDANARAMAAVIAAVRRAGVGERHVRTDQINVSPRFARISGSDYEEQARITGYVARNSISVSVVRLDRAPEVIAAGFAAGANSVSGPNLGSLDPQQGLAEARTAALRNAAAEAQAYADGLGMRIVRVLRVGETATTAEPVRFATSDIVVTGARAAAPPPPPIAGGEMRRTVTVYLSYALAPR